MAIEASQSVSTGTMTLTPQRSSVQPGFDRPRRHSPPAPPFEPQGPSAAGRALAAMARWFLVVVLVVLAPVGLISWSVIPRITSPSQLAAEAIESGLTGTVRSALVEQLATKLAELGGSPLPVDELLPIVERSLSQGWLDEQLTLVAGELDGWLNSPNDQPPDLVIDLAPVKRSLAANDDVVSLIAEAMGCSDPRCPPAKAALNELLGEIPGEASFLTNEADPDADPSQAVLAAKDGLQTVERSIAIIPLALVAALAVMVLLARRGSRIRWLGAILVAISLLILAVVTLLPGWASQRAVASLPGDFLLDRTILDGVLSWAMQPAGTLARWMLLAGTAALAASVALGVRRRRTDTERPSRRLARSPDSAPA